MTQLFGTIAGIVIAAAVALFLAWQLWRPAKSPIRAASMCDLLDATDIWSVRAECGCGPEDGIWRPCAAHKLLAEFETYAESEMREGNPS